jgi:hypothetical protein
MTAPKDEPSRAVPSRAVPSRAVPSALHPTLGGDETSTRRPRRAYRGNSHGCVAKLCRKRDF